MPFTEASGWILRKMSVYPPGAMQRCRLVGFVSSGSEIEKTPAERSSVPILRLISQNTFCWCLSLLELSALSRSFLKCSSPSVLLHPCRSIS